MQARSCHYGLTQVQLDHVERILQPVVGLECTQVCVWRCASTRATASSTASCPGCVPLMVRTCARTSFQANPSRTRRCQAFAAWKGFKPFGCTTQRKSMARSRSSTGRGSLQGEHSEPTMFMMSNDTCATRLHLGVTFVCLGKHSDPLWGLQGGSKSFPDPPEATQLCVWKPKPARSHRKGPGTTNPTKILIRRVQLQTSCWARG